MGSKTLAMLCCCETRQDRDKVWKSFRDKTKDQDKTNTFKTNQDSKRLFETRLFSHLKYRFETRRDFQSIQNLETRRDKTAFPVSSRLGNGQLLGQKLQNGKKIVNFGQMMLFQCFIAENIHL